jgi:hypothetical protein
MIASLKLYGCIALPYTPQHKPTHIPWSMRVKLFCLLCVATLTMGRCSWGNYQRWVNSTLISRARCLGRRSPSGYLESWAISSKYVESLGQASQAMSLLERWTCTHSSTSDRHHTQDLTVWAKVGMTFHYWISPWRWFISARGSSRSSPHASY